ncbi:uncharacterized protein HaLaN_26686, partial [Haematococcus lacustris]
MQQVCEAAERMVARLRRLDEVLPRYQRMASQLYELLRVRVLEEVVPAVTALVAHASAAEGVGWGGCHTGKEWAGVVVTQGMNGLG